METKSYVCAAIHRLKMEEAARNEEMYEIIRKKDVFAGDSMPADYCTVRMFRW